MAASSVDGFPLDLSPDNYTVEREIGRGGMATVYAARTRSMAAAWLSKSFARSWPRASVPIGFGARSRWQRVCSLVDESSFVSRKYLSVSFTWAFLRHDPRFERLLSEPDPSTSSGQ